jgi:hypothetical protein
VTTDKLVLCRSVVERTDSRLTQIDFEDSDPAALEPLAPGTLYLNEPGQTVVFELHRVVSITGRSVVFETFRDAVPAGWNEPSEGQRYRWRGWIIPAAWDAIQSRPEDWHLQSVEGDHEHCIITWETISKGEPGYYHPVLREWVSVAAFQKFMQDDIYRLRRGGS